MIGWRKALRQLRAVADDHYARWVHALGDDAVAHVFPEHDHPRRPAQRSPVQLLPALDPVAWADNLATEGHVRVEIADDVNKGPPGQLGNEGPGAPPDRRASANHGGHRPG